MGNGFCLVFGAGQDRNAVKIQNFLHKPRQSRRVKNRRSKYEKNISYIRLIKGINVGSGSYSAITNQITSKFFKGTIKRISFKTFSKMLKYNLIGNIIGALVSGLMDAFGANDWLIEIINQMTGW